MVGIITLAIGGVTITNHLLAAVAISQREIGIRKALGANNAHILGQFLSQAVILGLLGWSAGNPAG